jgi:transcription initiation factor TFIIIB Brf1 subunit/transcription initiation factor TFIIB
MFRSAVGFSYSVSPKRKLLKILELYSQLLEKMHLQSVVRDTAHFIVSSAVSMAENNSLFRTGSALILA